MAQFDLFPDLEPASNKGIGGSEVSALLGLNPNTSAFELWQDKTDRPRQHVTSASQARGIRLEPVVRELFERAAGQPLKPGRRTKHRRWHEGVHMTAATDGMYGSDGRIFEAKTTRVGSSRHTAFVASRVPVEYALQIQHYASVCGSPGGAIACLCGHHDEIPWDLTECSFHVAFWKRHDEVIERLERVVERWFTEHILGDRPPPQTQPESDFFVEALGQGHDWITEFRHWDGLEPLSEEEAADQVPTELSLDLDS